MASQVDKAADTTDSGMFLIRLLLNQFGIDN